jgi:hypothetical protein
LIDIVKPTEKGEIVEAKGEDSYLQNHVDMEGLTVCKYILPSMFLHTGRVSQLLTIKELGAIIDLPELFVMRLIESKEENVNKKVDIWKSLFEGKLPPLKIIQVARTIINCFESPIDDSNKDDASSSNAELVNHVHHSILELPKRTNGDTNITKAMDAVARYLRLHGQKAAKDDNVPVPVELWNGYFFEKFLPTLVYYPLVHGKALRDLRNKFGLRIFWQNVS